MASSTIASHYAAHLESLVQRHDQGLAHSGHDYLAIHSGAPRLRFLDDSHLPFAANPHFKAWLPLSAHPHCMIVYSPGKRPALIYHQPVDYWHKPPEAPSGFWVEHFDIHVVRDTAELAAHLPRGGRGALIGEPENLPAAPGFEHNPTALLHFLHFHRARKTAYEIACMRRANDIAVAGHRAAEAAFRNGAAEIDIHLAYLQAARVTDEELPYASIVALNENGATLHYQHRERAAPRQHHAFLIDAGAGCHGYAADITRTHAARDGEFQHLVDAVDEMQRALCGEIRAGVDYPALHLRTHERIAGVLLEQGLLRDIDAAGAVEQGITSVFFPHGLGHFLGLQVHDVGGFMADVDGNEIAKPPGHPFLRLTRRLEPDQVLTVEPGIYFIDTLMAELRTRPAGAHVAWARVDRLRPCGGVRIEDNVVVGAHGCENLTRDAFAAAAATPAR